MKHSKLFVFLFSVGFFLGCDRPPEQWRTSHKGGIYFRCENDTTLLTLGDDGCELGLAEVQLCARKANPDERFGTYFYEGHVGGWGDTFQYIGCNDSVWAVGFGNLFTIAVRKPWMGMTDTGIMLGDLLNDFLDAYPEARHLVNTIHKNNPQPQDDMDFWCTDNLLVNFDTEGKLSMMEVSRHGFDEYLEGDEYSSYIGPYGDEKWYE
ncbi:MAG: hypothetical protein COU07_02875 [Candidatus Harrisonbacteria bacterium CG10_big_fil_rev_8_21_14_0_10_40_38]|uniref:Uncharacterized protein n=1 Tax=Candidatus Harrisonbacteria bacterium CG10_big_fil_rev_8_21_14_0_10_40_38 TaxID=1974583 RepID=A0A2H0URV9_9BACT|nr:MAG: hypothetical protein COU07_02875 [Candidatus Harrisonbacteria bacterium CG10_big_fil_rev_8_21_14_0_10_40_38]